MQGRPDHALCLYPTASPDRQATAPWLVRLVEDGPAARGFMALPDDRHGGILFTSDRAAADLRRHFRRFALRIARRLAGAAGQAHGFDACKAAAQRAVEPGDVCGMPSEAQVSMPARAAPPFGPDLGARHAEAARILSDSDFAFQCKERRLEGIMQAMLRDARQKLLSAGRQQVCRGSNGPWMPTRRC